MGAPESAALQNSGGVRRNVLMLWRVAREGLASGLLDMIHWRRVRIVDLLPANVSSRCMYSRRKRLTCSYFC